MYNFKKTLAHLTELMILIIFLLLGIYVENYKNLLN